jgi:hypothetical protein
VRNVIVGRVPQSAPRLCLYAQTLLAVVVKKPLLRLPRPYPELPWKHGQTVIELNLIIRIPNRNHVRTGSSNQTTTPALTIGSTVYDCGSKDAFIRGLVATSHAENAAWDVKSLRVVRFPQLKTELRRDELRNPVSVVELRIDRCRWAFNCYFIKHTCGEWLVALGRCLALFLLIGLLGMQRTWLQSAVLMAHYGVRTDHCLAS